jgi:hypothetical protein
MSSRRARRPPTSSAIQSIVLASMYFPALSLGGESAATAVRAMLEFGAVAIDGAAACA